MAIVIHTTASDIARVTDTAVGSNTTIGINKPTNVVDGDLMILKVSSNNTLNPSSISISGDWTSINNNFNVNGSTSCHTGYYWKIWHTGDPTSWTATIGASTLDDESLVFRVTGHNPTTPIDAVGTFNSTQSVSPVCNGLTTLSNNAVVIWGVSAKNGSVLTGENAGEPTGTTLIQNRRSRNASGGVNSGVAYENRPTAGATGTRTWTSYTSTAQYHSTYAFAIAPGVSAAVSDVNTDEVVRVGSTGNTFTYTGFSGNPTSATIGGKSATNVVATGGNGTFDFPNYTDGQTYPLVGGSQTFTAVYSAEQASLSVTLSPQVGHSIVTVSGAVEDDPTYIGYHFDLNNNDTLDYVTSELTVYPDGGVEAANPGDYDIWHRNTSTQVMTLLNLTINEEGVVVSVSTGRVKLGIGLGVGI
jgi:hypothetical protein